MEPKNIEGLDREINVQIEELEEKIAPGFFFDTVWPFPNPISWSR
jgi:hypothetical protein